MRRLVLLVALAGVAAPAGAQRLDGSQLQLGPQVVRYRIAAPIDETVTELTLPVFAIMPITRALSLDIGTAYAHSRVEFAEGTSTIAGLTDTQLRANYAIGTDFIILTAGVNLPTGRSTVEADEFPAASRIANDFLGFPISNMGTGTAVTGGVAVARTLGGWNVGAGGSVRVASEFEPVRATDGDPVRYQPGNEYKVRIGADRPAGDGQVAFGLTYSKFGQDDFGGSLYNTGDRLLGQVGYSVPSPAGTLGLAAWNLYRGEGELVDGFTVPWDNIANGSVTLSVHAGAATIEPSVQVRSWWQAVAATDRDPARTDRSLLGELGVRARVPVGRVAVYPGAGYVVGRMAAGADQQASMTGFRASVGVQVR